MYHIIKFLKLIIISLLLVHFSNSLYAEKYKYAQEKNKKNQKMMAEACVPATGKTDLSVNNVRARINTGGDMWWDLQGNPEYEIPKGSKKTSMFSASLWIAGTDVNGQLKCAAVRYRQVGNDYWPGPLTTDGSAYVDAETCKQYDKHFIITRAEVDEFLAYRKDPSKYPDYQIPKSILEWPAHGDLTKYQSYYLAPFADVDGDGDYNPENGDYPLYDVKNEYCKTPTTTMEGNGILADQMLKGDQTLWWVFNDKGNIHTETGGSAIGMEIRAQAFAFATNDEINNMTFYTYELINRSTFRLTETYFSQWVDTDIGYAWDDFVGCDVLRGLGYCYNGDEIDGTGKPVEYGAQPPACGVDFFQGPYMDKDQLDNPKYNPKTGENCDESINGVNFADGIVDNERFGMRRFVYHNNSGGVMGDPSIAIHYYNYLRGIWKDGTKMLYGGNAHMSSGAYGPECDFMFPDETDPCNWGTGGLNPNGPKKWTEETANNTPYDRRFMQSAGPFTLEPGAVNYITVGIPWARTTTGNPWASVQKLRVVDDKCQRLFDNCFKVVDGPDAPNLVIQELDKELILYITNPKSSNNYNELYKEIDPSIMSQNGEKWDSIYRFEGYQIFQLKDANVSVSDIHDADLARLVFQCDIENYKDADKKEPISKLINFTYSDELGGSIPVQEVNGENKGINHSFRVIYDQFAKSDKRLVNHKQYYFLAIAYAFNEYKKYSQDLLAQIPGVSGLDGQKLPYLAGRKSAGGQPISYVVGIPHISNPEFGGNIMTGSYGEGVKIQRIEGQGNGGNVIAFSKSSIEEALLAPAYKCINPIYLNGKGPVDIKVINPLRVVKGNFILKFDVKNDKIDTARWIIINKDNGNIYNSDKNIGNPNEQLFLDLGLSVTIKQVKLPGDKNAIKNGYLNPSELDKNFKEMLFADSSKVWLWGIPDVDGSSSWNWIRSGTLADKDVPDNNDYNYTHDQNGTIAGTGLDDDEYYEKVVGRQWAPYRLCSKFSYGPAWNNGAVMDANKLENIASVDVVLTSDKSKWTKCPVIETCEDKLLAEKEVEKFSLRSGYSIDKDGNPDKNNTGMGWFPGYAVNLETGERLNMMYGENSWLVGENGNDMKFNPTYNYYTSLGELLWGGMHFIYIMGHNGDGVNDCPAYDEGKWLYDKLKSGTMANKVHAYKSAMWVNIPVAVEGEDWLACDVTIRLRVAKPYKRFYSTASNTAPAPLNNNYPMYSFNTNDIYTEINHKTTAKNALDLINIVPNPYYAYSKYEASQLDNIVKITNLPQKSTISIYSVNGVLIRQFKVDKSLTTSLKETGVLEPVTSIEWDLKNFAGIPISGGLYLIHINAPGLGERVIKWFGVLRPTDTSSF